MLGEAVGPASLRTETEHLAVDLLDPPDAALLQHRKEFPEHLRDRHRVVRCAVMVERRQLQMLRHDIKLVFAQSRQQVLRKDERVEISRVKRNAALLAPGAKKADVKLRVVRGKDAAARKVKKRTKRLFQLRRAPEHVVRNAGKSDDLRRQAALRVDKGLEGIDDLAVSHNDRADLRDRLGRDLKTGRFNVKAADFRRKIPVLIAVHGNAVIQIVDKIALAAVKYFDFTLAGMPGIREALRHTMIGDRDGGHAPLGGKPDDAARVGQRVHVGHLCMQVQLHALFRRVVHASLMLDRLNVARIELHILAVEGQLHRAADAQPHARRDLILHLRDLPLVHVAPDTDGAGVIGHLQNHDPHTGAARFMAVELKDLALDHHTAALSGQLSHRQDIALDLPAHDDPAARIDPSACALLQIGKRDGGGLDIERHARKLILPGKQLLQRGLRRIAHLLVHRHIKRHRAALRFKHHIGHKCGIQEHPQLKLG